MRAKLTYLSLMFAVITTVSGCFKKEVKFDQYSGQTESQVRARLGKPTKEFVDSSDKLLVGELAYPFRERLPENPVVKELYYKSGSGEQIFWLVSRSNTFTVFADVIIPSGVEF